LVRGLAVLATPLLVAACSIAGPTPTNYTAYQLTCCTQADIERDWQPGTSMNLHWIVQTAHVTTVNPTHRVVITAKLQGPHSDASNLKQSPAGGYDVSGSTITIDDRVPPSPETVMTFTLPAALPTGLYNLAIKWDLGDGSSAEGGSVVRVG
jgi:hypothetical protein